MPWHLQHRIVLTEENWHLQVAILLVLSEHNSLQWSEYTSMCNVLLEQGDKGIQPWHALCKVGAPLTDKPRHTDQASLFVHIAVRLSSLWNRPTAAKKRIDISMSKIGFNVNAARACFEHRLCAACRRPASRCNKSSCAPSC